MFTITPGQRLVVCVQYQMKADWFCKFYYKIRAVTDFQMFTIRSVERQFLQMFTIRSEKTQVMQMFTTKIRTWTAFANVHYKIRKERGFAIVYY